MIIFRFILSIWWSDAIRTFFPLMKKSTKKNLAPHRAPSFLDNPLSYMGAADGRG